MFAITIEWLMGVAHLDKRASGEPERAEWPPHPDRLFMALVAAWGGGDDDEAHALEWLESQPCPAIAAPDVEARPTITTYSPTNDRFLPSKATRKLKKLVAPLPRRGEFIADYISGGRNKERSLASVALRSPRVSFIWPEVPSDEIRSALSRIVSRLSYIGRSESVVAAWIDDQPPQANWVPHDHGSEQMRVPHSGRLRDLVAAYDANVMPTPNAWQAYRSRDDAWYVQGEWSGLIPFETIGPVDLRHSYQLARAVRKCILAACPEPIPTWVSGHTDDGDRIRGSHLAIVPLGNVGHHYADGRVLGVGLLLPSFVNPAERQRCLAQFCVTAQSIGDNVTLRRSETTRRAVTPWRWTQPSKSWGTVTPIACHRWPKRGRVEETLRKDVAHTGLPAPERMEIRATSPIKGGLYDAPFDAPRRYRVHAVLHWSAPVEGPVAIGAGRYLGLGWCAPMRGAG